MIRKILRFWNTIKYLKFIQIKYRILRKFKINIFFSKKNLNLRKVKKYSSFLENQFINLHGDKEFIFNNNKANLDDITWKAISKDDLWSYNLHYFNYLNSKKNDDKKNILKNLVFDWINFHETKKSIGLDPYPTSLRIVNWIKWGWKNNIRDKSFTMSLSAQTRYLFKNLEWHLLGNHLFSNAKALVFAGIFFSDKESDDWLKHGIRIINNQIKEQVLNDGGHFELTPMYHSLFLNDLLDLINLKNFSKNFLLQDNILFWQKTADKMFFWLKCMTHPDGKISYFNDSTFDVSLNFEEMKKYFEYKEKHFIESKKYPITYHLKDSGYINLIDDNFKAILDVGKIGPDYLPGHAHADTLSFEVSIFNHRIIVNSGISCYGINKQRFQERSTNAHNTVIIDNKDSSEVWSSFRVARRAYPINLNITNKAPYEIEISCSHDGYKRLKNKPVHKRKWTLVKNNFIIEDNIIGKFKEAYVNFFLHPGIIIDKINDNHYILSLNQKKIEILTSEKSKIIKTKYHVGFGKSLENSCLRIYFKNNKINTKVKWR